jgi:hypothetical protein
MTHWNLVFTIFSALVWPPILLPNPCSCGLPIYSERTYVPAPAEVDLPYYSVRFHPVHHRSMELVAVLHRFSNRGSARTTFISFNGANWKTSEANLAYDDQLVEIGPAPVWAIKDLNFGLKFAEGHLTVTRNHGDSWALVHDDDLLERPVTLKGRAEAVAALEARGLHSHFSVAAWQKLIIFSIVFDPVEPGSVYLISNQGIFKGCDYANSWTLLPVPAEMLFSVYSLAINPDNSSDLAVGTTDGVYISHDGGCTFARILGMRKK